MQLSDLIQPIGESARELVESVSPENLFVDPDRKELRDLVSIHGELRGQLFRDAEGMNHWVWFPAHEYLHGDFDRYIHQKLLWDDGDFHYVAVRTGKPVTCDSIWNSMPRKSYPGFDLYTKDRLRQGSAPELDESFMAEDDHEEFGLNDLESQIEPDPVQPGTVEITEAVADQIAKLKVGFVQKAVADLVSAEDLAQWVQAPTLMKNPEAAEYISGAIDAFDRLVQADPTQQKKYLGWLIRWALDRVKTEGLQAMEEMVEQDTPRAYRALDVLGRGQIRGFDINRAKTLSDLEDVTEPFYKVVAQKQAVQSEQDQIRAETQFIYKGPEGRIVSPTTERASRYWGRGTRWCTAYTDRPTYFQSYANKGDRLYIIMPVDAPQGQSGVQDKYQLALPSGEFRDPRDKSVDAYQFREKYPWVVPALGLKPEAISDLNRFIGYLEWIDISQLSESDIDDLLARTPKAISVLPLSPARIYARLDANPDLSMYLGSRMMVLAQQWGQNKTLELIDRHPEIGARTQFPLYAAHWDREATVPLIRKHPDILTNEKFLQLAAAQKWPNDLITSLILENPKWGNYKMVRRLVGDLPNKEIEKLLRANPEWATPELLYAMAGNKLTPRIMKAIANRFEEHGTDVPEYDPKLKLFLYAKYKSVDDCLEEVFGSDSAVYRYLKSENNFAEDWHFETSREDASYMFDELPEYVQNAIIRYAKATYPDSFQIDDGDNIDEVEISGSEALEILYDEDDEVFDILRHARGDGMRSGAESQAYSAAMSVLTDTLRTDCKLVMMDPPNMDGPMNVYLTPEGLVQNVDDIASGYSLKEIFSRTLSDVHEPQYGWDDYDEEVAVESALNELPSAVDEYVDDKEKAAYEKKRKAKAKSEGQPKWKQRMNDRIMANLNAVGAKPNAQQIKFMKESEQLGEAIQSRDLDGLQVWENPIRSDIVRIMDRIKYLRKSPRVFLRALVSNNLMVVWDGWRAIHAQVSKFYGQSFHRCWINLVDGVPTLHQDTAGAGDAPYSPEALRGMDSVKLAKLIVSDQIDHASDIPMTESVQNPPGTKNRWLKSEQAWFEYHCNRAHDSGDAQVWYRSHQPVTVLGVSSPGGGRTLAQRISDGEPRVYRIRFRDGLIWDAFEDELVTDRRYLQRGMGRPRDWKAHIKPAEEIAKLRPVSESEVPDHNGYPDWEQEIPVGNISEIPYYHGTARRRLVFSRNRVAYFTPDRAAAEDLAQTDVMEKGDRPALIEVRLNPRKIVGLYWMKMQDLHDYKYDGLVQKLRAQGYDAVVGLKEEGGKLVPSFDEVCVLNPYRIRKVSAERQPFRESEYRVMKFFWHPENGVEEWDGGHSGHHDIHHSDYVDQNPARFGDRAETKSELGQTHAVRQGWVRGLVEYRTDGQKHLSLHGMDMDAVRGAAKWAVRKYRPDDVYVFAQRQEWDRNLSGENLRRFLRGENLTESESYPDAFWWHPDQGMVVNRPGQLHTRALAEMPERFGLTMDFVQQRKSESNWNPVRDPILLGAAFDRGWVRVAVVGRPPMALIEGDDVRAIHSCLREIVKTIPVDRVVGETRTGHFMLDTLEDVERFLKTGRATLKEGLSSLDWALHEATRPNMEKFYWHPEKGMQVWNGGLGGPEDVHHNNYAQTNPALFGIPAPGQRPQDHARDQGWVRGSVYGSTLNVYGPDSRMVRAAAKDAVRKYRPLTLNISVERGEEDFSDSYSGPDIGQYLSGRHDPVRDYKNLNEGLVTIDEARQVGVQALWAQLEAIPRSEGIEAAESNWIGSVANYGDPQAAYQVQQMPGYFDYQGEIANVLQRVYGESVPVFRNMTREEYREWQSGTDLGPKACTINPALARSWSNLAAHRGADRVVVAFQAPVESVVMLGHSSERELVVDLNQVSFDQTRLVERQEQIVRNQYGKVAEINVLVDPSPEEFLGWFSRVQDQYARGWIIAGKQGESIVIWDGNDGLHGNLRSALIQEWGVDPKHWLEIASYKPRDDWESFGPTLHWNSDTDLNRTEWGQRLVRRLSRTPALAEAVQEPVEALMSALEPVTTYGENAELISKAQPRGYVELAESKRPGNWVEISFIRALERNGGKTIMGLVCEAADRLGIGLDLLASEQHGSDWGDLIRFYESFGFETIRSEHEGSYMERRPRGSLTESLYEVRGWLKPDGEAVFGTEPHQNIAQHWFQKNGVDYHAMGAKGTAFNSGWMYVSADSAYFEAMVRSGRTPTSSQYDALIDLVKRVHARGFAFGFGEHRTDGLNRAEALRWLNSVRRGTGQIGESERAIPARLYHATQSENVEGILQHGLMPGMPANHEDSDPHLVYLSANPNSTVVWAGRAPDYHGVVVLAIDTSQLDPGRFGDDRILSQFPGSDMYWTYRGVIPPSAISRALTEAYRIRPDYTFGGSPAYAKEIEAAKPYRLELVGQTHANGVGQMNRMRFVDGPRTGEIIQVVPDALLAEAQHQQNSPEFQNWFGTKSRYNQSQVTHPNGKPMVVYRGYARAEPAGAGMRPSRATPSYVALPAVASAYASHEGAAAPNVEPVYLNLRNPLDLVGMYALTNVYDLLASSGIETEPAPVVAKLFHDIAERIGLNVAALRGWSSEVGPDELADDIERAGPDWFEKLEDLLMETQMDAFYIGDSHLWVELLKKHGFDGLIHWDPAEGLPDEVRADLNKGYHVTYRPFYPNQIKSAIGNSGAFNPDSPVTTEAVESKSPGVSVYEDLLEDRGEGTWSGGWIDARGEVHELDHDADIHHSDLVWSEFGAQAGEDGPEAAMSLALQAGWIRIIHDDEDYQFGFDWENPSKAALTRLLSIVFHGRWTQWMGNQREWTKPNLVRAIQRRIRKDVISEADLRHLYADQARWLQVQIEWDPLEQGEPRTWTVHAVVNPSAQQLRGLMKRALFGVVSGGHDSAGNWVWWGAPKQVDHLVIPALAKEGIQTSPALYLTDPDMISGLPPQWFAQEERPPDPAEIARKKAEHEAFVAKWIADEKAKRHPEERPKLPFSNSNQPMYIRFGLPPKSGKSEVGQLPNALMGLFMEPEDYIHAGVSVFPVRYNHKTNTWDFDNRNLTDSGYASLDELLAQAAEHRRPMYLVTGDEIDGEEGMDGEPLLKNVRILDDTLTLRDVRHEGYYEPEGNEWSSPEWPGPGFSKYAYVGPSYEHPQVIYTNQPSDVEVGKQQGKKVVLRPMPRIPQRYRKSGLSEATHVVGRAQIHINPGMNEIIGMLRNSRHHYLRGILFHDLDGQPQFVVWDGNDAIHHDIAVELRREWDWDYQFQVEISIGTQQAKWRRVGRFPDGGDVLAHVYPELNWAEFYEIPAIRLLGRRVPMPESQVPGYVLARDESDEELG